MEGKKCLRCSRPAAPDRACCAECLKKNAMDRRRRNPPTGRRPGPARVYA